MARRFLIILIGIIFPYYLSVPIYEFPVKELNLLFLILEFSFIAITFHYRRVETSITFHYNFIINASFMYGGSDDAEPVVADAVPNRLV